MYVDKDEIQEYPFIARFYRISVDESKPLDEQVEEKMLVLETPCDITEASHSISTNFIWGKYSVYIPLDKDKERVVIKTGDVFESDFYGLDVNGKVVGVFPSQLGGITCYIQDTEA